MSSVPRIASGWLPCIVSKSRALPRSRPCTATGMASRSTARSMESCAWLRLTPGFSSKEIEVDANCPQWLTRSGAVVCS